MYIKHTGTQKSNYINSPHTMTALRESISFHMVVQMYTTVYKGDTVYIVE